jgi:hypothetical protein
MSSWKVRLEHKVDPLLSQLPLPGALQNAGELDLAKATAVAGDDPGRRFVEGALGKIDLHRRAAGIADHDGPVAVGSIGKVAIVSIFPTGGYQHAVGPQIGPVVQVGVAARLAKLGNGRQEKSQAGRG